jgi:hypothetical protein
VGAVIRNHSRKREPEVIRAVLGLQNSVFLFGTNFVGFSDQKVMNFLENFSLVQIGLFFIKKFPKYSPNS